MCFFVFFFLVREKQRPMEVMFFSTCPPSPGGSQEGDPKRSQVTEMICAPKDIQNLYISSSFSMQMYAVYTPSIQLQYLYMQTHRSFRFYLTTSCAFHFCLRGVRNPLPSSFTQSRTERRRKPFFVGFFPAMSSKLQQVEP